MAQKKYYKMMSQKMTKLVKEKKQMKRNYQIQYL